MIKTLDWILNTTEKYRKSIGIAFFFFGSPIVYFLRDGIKLAPNNKAFTAALLFGGLLLAFPLKKTDKLYVSNSLITAAFLTFWLLAVTYLIVYVPHAWFTSRPTEFAYLTIILLAFFIFSSTSYYDLKDTFVPVVILTCLVGSLCMLFFVFTNPSYVWGARAGISFQNEETGTSTTNPHIYAKVAYMGLVASIVYHTYTKSSIIKLGLIGINMINFLVLVMTQAFAIFASFGIFLMVFIFFNTSANSVYKILKWIFGWRGILLFTIVIATLTYLIVYTRFDDYVLNILDNILTRVDKITTLFSNSNALGVRVKSTTIDTSANERIVLLKEVWETMVYQFEHNQWLLLLFGNGYQHLYVDVPIVEAYHDLGLIGFFSFLVIHLVFGYYMIKIYQNSKNTSIFIVFLGYAFILNFINSFVAGLPYDYQRWTMILFVSRFCLPQYFGINQFGNQNIHQLATK
jgi:hypothetical protein